jgi:hypothetical protein
MFLARGVPRLFDAGLVLTHPDINSEFNILNANLIAAVGSQFILFIISIAAEKQELAIKLSAPGHAQCRACDSSVTVRLRKLRYRTVTQQFVLLISFECRRGE